MEVIVQDNQEAAAHLVARIVAHDLMANPHLVLGLATGQTMECVYRHLVRKHRDEHLDFSLCSTFNLDEYVGIFPSDPNSYRHYMTHHLFRHVNVDIRNTHLPNGMAENLDEECRHYEATIKRFNGISVLAHPYSDRPENRLPLSLVDDLISRGLDGIEILGKKIPANHPYVRKLLRRARKSGLVLTGGSDTHNKGKRCEMGKNSFDYHDELLKGGPINPKVPPIRQ